MRRFGAFGAVGRAGRTDLALAFFSAVLGVLVTALLTTQNRPAPDWLLFLGLSLVIATVAVLVVKIDDIKRSLPTLIEAANGGVRFISRDEGSMLGAERVLQSSVIRVLGTARQDTIDVNESARHYLNATEKRVRQRRRPLYYRRITSDVLRPPLVKHLVKLLADGEQSQLSRVQVALIPCIESAISYQVFDETSVLVIVDSPTVPGVRDNSFSFISSDPNIVRAFSNHFDHAWTQLNPLDNGDLVMRSLRSASS